MTNLANTGRDLFCKIVHHTVYQMASPEFEDAYNYALLDGKGSTYQSTCTLLSSLI